MWGEDGGRGWWGGGGAGGKCVALWWCIVLGACCVCGMAFAVNTEFGINTRRYTLSLTTCFARCLALYRTYDHAPAVVVSVSRTSAAECVSFGGGDDSGKVT